jgi:iron(III) transport system ATP-binding protein
VVCIRPQGVRLKPPGFCLDGRVRSRRFLGEVDLVHVAVQGLDRPLQARVREPDRAGPGRDVGVDIDTREVLVFPSSQAA